MTNGRIDQGTVTEVRDPRGVRPKADIRDVAIRVNQYAGRRTARSSPLSQSIVLLKYQMHRREKRQEQLAISGRSGASRWSAGRERVLSHCGGGPIGKGDYLVSPLFLWSAWAQLLWWRPGRQGRSSGLASVPLVGVGSGTVVVGRWARALFCSRLCSYGRRGHSLCGGDPVGKCVVLLSTLFLWSSWF
jgi:hypothetical protein